MTARKSLLQAHLDAELCWDAAKLRASAAHWPEEVTLSWMMRNPQRGGTRVSDIDSIHRACKLLSRDADGKARLERAIRAIVLRSARVHAARSCDREGLAEQAAALRALPDDASWEQIRATARAAAAYARYAAAYAASAAFTASAADAERAQQVIDLADAADGWVPGGGHG